MDPHSNSAALADKFPTLFSHLGNGIILDVPTSESCNDKCKLLEGRGCVCLIPYVKHTLMVKR